MTLHCFLQVSANLHLALAFPYQSLNLQTARHQVLSFSLLHHDELIMLSKVTLNFEVGAPCFYIHNVSNALLVIELGNHFKIICSIFLGRTQKIYYLTILALREGTRDEEEENLKG